MRVQAEHNPASARIGSAKQYTRRFFCRHTEIAYQWTDASPLSFHDFGADKAGTDRRNIDFSTVFLPQCLRKRTNGRFGSRIDRCAGQRTERVSTGHVYNRTPCLFFEYRNEFFRSPYHGILIKRKTLLDFVLRILSKLCKSRKHPRVVDKHVGFKSPHADISRKLFPALTVGDVHSDVLKMIGKLTEFRSDPQQFLFVPRHTKHTAAIPSYQKQRQFPAQSARGSGHNHISTF